ncbi:glycosyltransferase family 2 protein [Ideonella livida]|uniref:Glycosyltransferase family 2 protein n=1 Tax=Ideonella livida TaxID=2707176 RepID=A0A7C9TIX5_9BURK|nr:glycosyltransferase family 2 protein [Ideonella livida]NDY90165.1 glycosyltransferase family 2 protein [Ideonella livida]
MSAPTQAPWMALAWARLQARGRRSVKRLRRPGWMQRLQQTNLHSREPVVAPGGPVVSLTTYGPRLQEVHLTLESIAAGRLKPSRLTLWVGHETLAAGLPAALQRLQARGLEVHAGADWGPHTKYFPLVTSLRGCERPAVTADDDQLYPADWLQALWQAHLAQPGLVHCHRAHRIGLEAQGGLRPYRQWGECHSTAPSPLHFATGVSGVLYPVAVLQALRAQGEAFTACCPRADDIWLNVVALRCGAGVRQLAVLPRAYYELPGTRAQGLAQHNVGEGGNDLQLARTYGPQDLAVLRQAAGLS